MRSKVAIFAVLCAVLLLLAGCGDSLVYKNGIADIKNANITISFPEDWTVCTGNKAYDELRKELDYEGFSAKDLKALYEANGTRLLLSAQSSDESVSVKLTEVCKGDKSAEEMVREAHDDTVDDYDSSEFFTVAESSFGEYAWGGVSGVMSVIRLAVKEDGHVFAEWREFGFERDDTVFRLQIRILAGFEQDADGIEISARE